MQADMRTNRPYNFRFDAQMNPIGHKIETAETPMRIKKSVPAHSTPEAAAICLNCTRNRCPGNCTRVSGITNVTLEYKGKRYTMQELADISGLPKSTIYFRIKRGMPVEQAVETPKQKAGRKKKNG